MLTSDKTLKCRDCDTEFVFTSGEQAFYEARGLSNTPQRCPGCRANRRREKAGLPAREMHRVSCATCGSLSFVPFAPRQDRPVYCSNCFEQVRTGKTEA